MPTIDVNKKRGENVQVDLSDYLTDNKNLENPNNTLLPVSWGVDIGHVTSRIANKESDLFVPIGKNENGYVTFDLTLGRDILAGGSMLSGVGMFRRVSLVSLLKTNKPENLRIVLIDPKGLMSDFDTDPHLQFSRSKTQEEVVRAIKWCQEETDRRLNLLQQSNVVHVSDYNRYKSVDGLALPSIVIFISELGDLIDIPNFDTLLYKIAGMTRATNIHFIITTQQPSVDVVTPIILETFTNRIAFQMPYEAESVLFVEQEGAEKLLGQGDMLFKNGYDNSVLHLQGLYYPS